MRSYKRSKINLTTSLVYYLIDVLVVTSCAPETPGTHDFDPYLFGSAVKPREFLDHWNESVMILSLDNTSSSLDGVISAWNVYVNRSGDVSFQVWRPEESETESNHLYKLIGQNSFHIDNPPGEKSFTVSDRDRIAFRVGDVIGLYIKTANPIPFSKHASGCEHPMLYLHEMTTLPVISKVYAFRTKEAGWNPCRLYSVNARIIPVDDDETGDTNRIINHDVQRSIFGIRDVDIELHLGRVPNEGKVRIHPRGSSNDYWGTICSDGWTHQDAKSVCRKLGYDDGHAIYPPFFGTEGAQGRVYQSTLLCNDTRLPFNEAMGDSYDGDRTLLLSTCSHRADAGATCWNEEDETSRERAYGYPAVSRHFIDRNQHEDTLLVTTGHMALNIASGNVTAWHFFARRDMLPFNIAFQIWRPLNTHGAFILVGQTRLMNSRHYLGNTIFKLAEGIPVRRGDVIGLSFNSANPIPYDVSPECDSSSGMILTAYRNATAMNHDVNSTVRFFVNSPMRRLCRTYSVFATIQPTDPTVSLVNTSEIMIRSAESADRKTANTRCQEIYGIEAGLPNMTSEAAYDVIVTYLEQTDMDEGSTVWLGGQVHDLNPGFRFWDKGHPVSGRECITLTKRRAEPSQGASFSYFMTSSLCSDSHRILCVFNLAEFHDDYPVAMGTKPSTPRPQHQVHNALHKSRIAAMSEKARKRQRDLVVSLSVSCVVTVCAVLALVIIIRTVLRSRNCRHRLGPNDIPESAVRFLSLYDKVPI